MNALLRRVAREEGEAIVNVLTAAARAGDAAAAGALLDAITRAGAP